MKWDISKHDKIKQIWSKHDIFVYRISVCYVENGSQGCQSRIHIKNICTVCWYTVFYWNHSRWHFNLSPIQTQLAVRLSFRLHAIDRLLYSFCTINVQQFCYPALVTQFLNGMPNIRIQRFSKTLQKNQSDYKPLWQLFFVFLWNLKTTQCFV